MKETDFIGFGLIAIVLVICYFIVRRISFPYFWLKVLCSIVVPFSICMPLAFINMYARMPLYLNGVVGISWIGITLEMFVFSKVKKRNKHEI